MKKYFFLLLLFSSFGTVAQLSDPNPKVEEIAKVSIQKANADAEKDIKNKTISIFLQGGIVPTKTNSDHDFSKKYSIGITEFGCVGLDRNYSVAYNKVIFKYLDREFGKTWRSEIRKDMIGFTEYITSNN